MSTPTSIGLPKLQIAFEAAAQQTINRSKKGYEAMIVRDTESPGPAQAEQRHHDPVGAGRGKSGPGQAGL